MNLQDILYLAAVAVVWYLLVAKILPRFGVGT
jgi:hypothetical protein